MANRPSGFSHSPFTCVCRGCEQKSSVRNETEQRQRRLFGCCRNGVGGHEINQGGAGVWALGTEWDTYAHFVVLSKLLDKCS